MDNETRSSSALRFSKIWWSSRAKSGKSQEYMALSIGVSKKTIQNWEKGISSPNLFQFFQWFKILDINPIPYILSYMYPESIDNIRPSDNDENINTALLELVNNCTPLEKRQLLFVMHSSHGSSWHCLLQMMTAYCHTSLRSKISVASLIYNNYNFEHDTKELVCPENVAPDINVLHSAINSAKETAKRILLEKKK